MKALSKAGEHTIHNLTEAFRRLYRQKPIDRISIREITDIAGYNRSTFYLYFTDIYDLADYAENRLLEKISAEVQAILDEDENIIPGDFLVRMSSVSATYAEELYLFSASPSFQRKFKKAVEPNFNRLLHVDKERKEYDFFISLLISVMIHNLNYYHQNKDIVTMEELINYTHTLIIPGVEQYLKIDRSRSR